MGFTRIVKAGDYSLSDLCAARVVKRLFGKNVLWIVFVLTTLICVECTDSVRCQSQLAKSAKKHSYPSNGVGIAMPNAGPLRRNRWVLC